MQSFECQANELSFQSINEKPLKKSKKWFLSAVKWERDKAETGNQFEGCNKDKKKKLTKFDHQDIKTDDVLKYI